MWSSWSGSPFLVWELATTTVEAVEVVQRFGLPTLPSNDEVKQFIVEGFVEIPIVNDELPLGFHRKWRWQEEGQ
jgi:hypothetical protein